MISLHTRGLDPDRAARMAAALREMSLGDPVETRGVSVLAGLMSAKFEAVQAAADFQTVQLEAEDDSPRMN
ncbi:hypothetical protein [Defluviimonas salinarum]|uniref:Uncharacterized protein n=1 Tax=Defluviimonas salinarum TaxID=2992147 RepID=A0ABT3J4A9_9RHOB|nr:hypothetical protein [Defluviimonas salinarum]MCW3782522.1 hypothetical protein [Defluviimonas salinarum]